MAEGDAVTAVGTPADRGHGAQTLQVTDRAQ